MRIGGEFEIRMESILRSPEVGNFLPIKKKKYTWVDTGRAALFVALQEIVRKGMKREAWLPVFCCESVVAPFRQLGFTIHFYSMGEDLLSPSGLPPSLENTTFLFINYFGKNNKPIIEWIKQNRSASTIIIEDNVQAPLSENVGNIGDYVIYSLRKILPQPDGAILAYNGETIEAHLLPPDEQFISEKVIGKIMRGAKGDPDTFLPLFSNSEEKIDAIVQPRMMSTFSRFLFERTNLIEVRETRIRNWTLLHDRLHVGKHDEQAFRPLYCSLEDGEVPLGYPIVVRKQRRDDIRRALAARNIFCPVHWPISEDREGYRESFKDIQLSLSILTLPIDQRVTPWEIDYLVETLTHLVGEDIHHEGK